MLTVYYNRINRISCVQRYGFLNYSSFIHLVENLAVKEKYKQNYKQTKN